MYETIFPINDKMNFLSVYVVWVLFLVFFVVCLFLKCKHYVCFISCFFSEALQWQVLSIIRINMEPINLLASAPIASFYDYTVCITLFSMCEIFKTCYHDQIENYNCVMSHVNANLSIHALHRFCCLVHMYDYGNKLCLYCYSYTVYIQTSGIPDDHSQKIAIHYPLTCWGLVPLVYHCGVCIR